MEYMFLYLIVGATIAFVITNKFFYQWAKVLIIGYYLVLTFVFVNGKRNIEEKYYYSVPVPSEYWDQNSSWVYSLDGFFFWPLLAIVLYSYTKWIINNKEKLKRTLILISILPVGGIILFCAFMFGFVYGYRP